MAMAMATGPVIQRVGEHKYDVAPIAGPAEGILAQEYLQGQGRLRRAVAETKASRKTAKDDHWQRIRRDSESPDKNDKTGINARYATGLGARTIKEDLPQHDFFKFDPGRDWLLEADWQPGAATAEVGTIKEKFKLNMPTRYGVQVQNRRIPLAVVKPRDLTEAQDRPAEAQRALFTGGGKEYVKDARGVATRRYAYVEKNYFQMMEFFATNHMEGRFQSLMRASSGEQRPDPRTPGDANFIGKFQKTGKGGTLSDTQLAYVHQYLGSGDHQRGLSLASTPRKGETIGNAGENFRTSGGFRIKIDLARIAEDNAPALINHYAKGGVKDQLADGDFNAVAAHGGAYKYGESVTKNRELYLEFLKPEYVVEIEYHPDAAVGALSSQSFALQQPGGAEDMGAMLAAAKDAAHFASYQRGFDSGVNLAALSVDAAYAADVGFLATNPVAASTEAWKKGWASGNEYRLAYAGVVAAKGTGRLNANEDAFPDRRPQGQVASKDEHTIAKLARIHALHDRQMIGGLAGLGPTAPARIIHQLPPVVPAPRVVNARAATQPANGPTANPSPAPVLSYAAMTTRQQPTANPPTVPAPRTQTTAPRSQAPVTKGKSPRGTGNGQPRRKKF